MVRSGQVSAFLSAGWPACRARAGAGAGAARRCRAGTGAGGPWVRCHAGYHCAERVVRAPMGAPTGPLRRPAPPPARSRLTHRTCADLHGRPGHLLHHAATGPGSARAPTCTTPAPPVFWCPGGRAAKCPDTRSWGRRWPARPRRPCRGVQCGARPAPASVQCRFVSAGTARPSTSTTARDAATHHGHGAPPPASGRRALPESRHPGTRPPARPAAPQRTGPPAAGLSVAPRRLQCTNNMTLAITICAVKSSVTTFTTLHSQSLTICLYMPLGHISNL